MLATLARTELIATVALSLAAAMVFGYIARRLGLSTIVGYMLAGVLVGPHTPGFVADQALADQLAEIGIALLMFGVGLHFSLDDLAAVRRVAVPGAIVQSALATGAGTLVAWAAGWPTSAGLVFGLALSVASTVVLVRGLTDQRQLDSLHGHVAVGWLVVEDLFTVLALVLLPALAPGGDGGTGLAAQLGRTMLELGALAVLYVGGTRLVPWFLGHVAALQSRELFTLSVLGLALGIAYGASATLSVSMALGAFLGGMTVGRSDLSHQAAADALPLRDAFAVLFFVSVGMLFDPTVLLREPLLVIATSLVVLVVKPVAALVLTIGLGYPIRTGLTVAAGLGQIGEFSFILGGLGRSLGILSDLANQVLVAVALLGIALNPLLFALVTPLENRLRRIPWIARLADSRIRGAGTPPAPSREPDPATPVGHVVLCGHGRSGSVLGKLARERGWPLVVVEQDRGIVLALRRDGIRAIQGDAASEVALAEAHIAAAKLLVVALPDPLATRQIVALARRLTPDLEIVARAQDTAEREFLERTPRVTAVVAELELAIELGRHTLLRFGVSQIEAQAIAHDLRRGVSGSRDGARVLEVRIEPGAPAAGRKLAELNLGRGTLVMAIDRGGRLRVPDGQTELAAGDVVLLITDREELAPLRALHAGPDITAGSGVEGSRQ